MRLTNFRNLRALEWSPAPGWNRVEAPNGGGKSSLLEAIYLASTGKSFRTVELDDCRTRTPSSARAEEAESATTVFAEVERDGLWELGFALTGEGRSRTLQGKPTTLAALLERLPLVVWSEAENEFVRGADRARRRFFDRAALLVDPASAASEAEHARAWRQKRHLLQSGTSRGLAAWNELLAPHLVRRAALRRALAEELARRVNDLLRDREARLPRTDIDYQPSPAEALIDETATLGALSACAAEERAARLPLAGPHRDRFAIRLGDSGTRRFASGGEQKIVGLAVFAALAELLAARGRSPVVLLDDLESELDPARIRLAHALFAGALQVVSTSSRAVLEGVREGSSWRLHQGAINLADSDV